MIKKPWLIAGLLGLMGCTEPNPSYIQPSEAGASVVDLSEARDGAVLPVVDLSSAERDFSVAPFDLSLDDSLGLEDLALGTDLVIPSDLVTLGDLASQPDLKTPCYTNNFANANDLVIQTGGWRINNGTLEQPILSSQIFSIAYFSNQTYKDFIAKIKIMITDGANPNYFGLVFRYNRKSQNGYNVDIDQGYWIQLANGDGQTFDYILSEVYANRLIGKRVDAKNGEWYDLEVRVKGAQIDAFFDNMFIFSTRQNLHDEGYIGFGSFNGTGVFKDLQVCPQ